MAKAKANDSAPAEWTGGLIGHAAALHVLSRAIATGRVPHAYLFVGPDRVGKRTVARRMAAELLGSSLDTHPDFIGVERERDAKTDKLHADITIAQVRAMIGRLSLGAMMRGWKVCIVDDAQFLNRESGNALLKTLEEPHERTLLILTATSEEQVLPTVRSRCQTVRFTRVPTAELAAALAARGTAPDRADLYARLSGGRAGAAVTFAEDPRSLEEMFALREQLLALPLQRMAERFATVDRSLPAKMPFQDAVLRAGAWTDLAAELLRDALLIRLGAADRIVHFDVADRITTWSERADPAAALAVLESGRRLLDANVSPRAVLDRAALAF